jgi:SAM-dependent methyltransferase
VATGVRSWFFAAPVGTGGTISARYCYSVFMRHRVIAARHGLTNCPVNVLELGPGDSLGIGLMALLTGSSQYTAVDAVRHASVAANLKVFDELVELLLNRTPIPHDKECATILPALDDYQFPHSLFTPDELSKSLALPRLEHLREQLHSLESSTVIRYFAPGGQLRSLISESVDWIFSQAVLEHVDRPEQTYAQCFRCLKANGLMTHQIDYQCHETATRWNGHWAYPRWLWALIKGNRPWFINRMPHSAHIKMHQAAGFDICTEALYRPGPGIARHELAAPFKDLSADDLATASALVVSGKPSP